jgi:hypothetical protein
MNDRTPAAFSKKQPKLLFLPLVLCSWGAMPGFGETLQVSKSQANWERLIFIARKFVKLMGGRSITRLQSTKRLR